MAASDGRVVLQTEDVGQPGPGQLLVKTQFSTLSPGTEADLLAGRILRLPQAIGYSVAGTVVAVGDGVSGYKQGDAVVATARHAAYQDRKSVV